MSLRSGKAGLIQKSSDTIGDVLLEVVEGAALVQVVEVIVEGVSGVDYYCSFFPGLFHR